MRIESDRLGLKPVYLAQFTDGVILGNRLLDLMSLEPSLASPIDILALQELQAFGYPLRMPKLHAQIARSPTGATVAQPVSVDLRPEAAETAD